MGSHVNYSGLVIAGIGFFLTRFTVTLALYEEPAQFYLAGVVPLVLGLGLAAFGVALTVADVDADLVRTTAVWCVIGAVTMLVLVVLTLLGSATGDMPAFEVARSRVYLSNFLIGGSVGGSLTGLYASRNRRQRGELHQQANRLEILNRLLRHEILNAVSVIRGYASLRAEESPEAQEVIEARSDAIESTIEEVKYLTQSARTTDRSSVSIDVEACLRAAIEAIRTEHPEAEITVGDVPEHTTVLATDRLEHVFGHLLENAIVHADVEAPTVSVSVRETATSIRVAIADEGPGLPSSQQALLETGDIDEFDNPGMGFGLNVVRLLVESFHGSVETAVDDDGSTVTVSLPRADRVGSGVRPSPVGLTGVRPAGPHLVVTLAASVVAAIAYGVVVGLAGGSVGGIGMLYGTEEPNLVIGWITHEFHSAVFAFVFAGLVSFAPARYRNHVPAYVAIGLAWGVVLWFVAAGFVSSIWLNLIGIPVPIPSLRPVSLASHLVWGGTLGVLTALGYEHLTSWLAALWDRIGRSVTGVDQRA